jgi:hypothetical protein
MDVSALPPALSALILALVPVHTKLRCREVSRGWRDMLRAPSAWAVLDFRDVPLDAMTREGMTHAALACARGGVLHVYAWRTVLLPDGAALVEQHGGVVTLPLLLALLRGAAASLRTLDVTELRAQREEELPGRGPSLRHLSAATLRALLAAAPGVCALEACLFARCAVTARHVLSRAPPFAPVRLHELRFETRSVDSDDKYRYSDFDEEDDDDEAEAQEGDERPAPQRSVLALSAALASHVSPPLLRSLVIRAPLVDWDAEEALGALGAGLAAQGAALTCLRFEECGLDEDAVAPLARLLLRCASLRELALTTTPFTAGPLLDEAWPERTAALAGALLSRRALRSLELRGHDFSGTTGAFALLLCGVRGHARLETLCLHSLHGLDVHAAACAVAALLSADAPSLTTLLLRGCAFHDGCVTPLFDALACNSHLRELLWREDERGWLALRSTHVACGDELVTAVVAPAVRACASLRALTLPADSPAVRALQAELAEERRSTFY